MHLWYSLVQTAGLGGNSVVTASGAFELGRRRLSDSSQRVTDACDSMMMIIIILRIIIVVITIVIIIISILVIVIMKSIRQNLLARFTPGVGGIGSVAGAGRGAASRKTSMVVSGLGIRVQGLGFRV